MWVDKFKNTDNLVANLEWRLGPVELH
jgi:hypothetical protein